MTEPIQPEPGEQGKKPAAAAPAASPNEAPKAAEAAATSTAGASGSAAAESVPAQVTIRPIRYMVASRPAPGQLQPMAVESIAGVLDEMPGVKVLRRMKARGLGVLSA